CSGGRGGSVCTGIALTRSNAKNGSEPICTRQTPTRSAHFGIIGVLAGDKKRNCPYSGSVKLPKATNAPARHPCDIVGLEAENVTPRGGDALAWAESMPSRSGQCRTTVKEPV
ncbi:MAG: hypothetical protein ACREPX_10935, partial [Rhodanobacteraceae bacterium]